MPLKMVRLCYWRLDLEYLSGCRLNWSLSDKISLFFQVCQFLTVLFVPKPFIYAFEVKIYRVCKTFDFLSVPFAGLRCFNVELLHRIYLFFSFLFEFKAFAALRCQLCLFAFYHSALFFHLFWSVFRFILLLIFNG